LICKYCILETVLGRASRVAPPGDREGQTLAAATPSVPPPR
jgi:hypothetical protein